MRRLSAVLTTLVLTVVAAGCSGGGESDREEAARATAGEVADALAAGELDDLGWADPSGAEAAAAYDEIVAGLGEIEPTVEVGDVRVEGDAATVSLSWSWPVGRGKDVWEYDAALGLRRSGEEWAPVWAPTLVEPSLKKGEVLTATTVPSARGRITGADGAVIVTERPVLRFGVNRVEVDGKAADDAARALARLAGIDVAPYVKTVRAAGDRAFVEAITYRRGEVPAAVRSGSGDIPGVLIVADRLALAPTREFAAPILGRVGPVTAEMVKDDPATYRVGDVAGVSGLQARYDDRLRGDVGVVVQAATPEQDRGPRELYRIDAAGGDDLALTLDPSLQTAAERLLAGVGPAAALVALRPSDGAVLAAANGPGNAGQNYATYGQFAPGSTFKVVSSLALLRAGLTPDSTVPCTPTVDVDGRDFENYDDYPPSALGDIPLRTAIAQSCNTAVISQRDRLSPDALSDAAADLGVGVDHDLGFPAYFGSVPEPGSETEEAAAMIGQGKVLASPMAMAAVIASVQEGAGVVPHLMADAKPTTRASGGLTATEARQLRGMLRQAVTGGSAAALADVPGPPVIAKTGTAEFEGARRLQTHAWMVAAQGDLAVAVFVELGASGSRTAGPVLEAFLRQA